jgi:nitroreductase
MDVLEAIRERRSIRAFQDRPIPQEAVEALIEALTWAPSAGNLQSRRFFFVFNPTLRRRLVDAAWGQDFIAEAPLVIVACADHERIRWRYRDRGVYLYSLLDVAAAVQNLMLAAHALGLGTVWVGAFDEAAVSRLLNLPSGLRPVTLVPVGYPAERPSAPRRLPREQLITFVE